MNKEELFLKYIDDETNPEENLQVESILSESEANKELLEKIKTTRNEVLRNLEILNSDEAFIIPPFKQEQIKSKIKSFHIKLWHYAATAVILIGIYFGSKYLNDSKEHQIVEALPEHVDESKTLYKELDCYISPNRCWNQKQLVWTILEINH